MEGSAVHLTDAETCDRGQRVLIIDDDASIRNLFRIILELEGHTVLEAQDGVEGALVAARNQPDIVVVDYMMPGADGETTGQKVRAAVPESMLIAFTASSISRPYWADLFVSKCNIGEFPDIVARYARSPQLVG